MEHPTTTPRLSSLALSQFTAFGEKETLQFAPGINVLIGENGSGKTHLMKLLYALTRLRDAPRNGSSKEERERKVATFLEEYFKPDGLGRLARRGQGKRSASVQVTYTDQQTTSFQLNSASQARVTLGDYAEPCPISTLYFPATEVLTLSQGFVGLYQNYQLPYDKTYFDLAVALDSPLLRGPRLQEAEELIGPLEQATGLKVTRSEGKFYLKVDGNNKIEAALAAEGMKKIGGLLYLIGNGQLNSSSVVFWDEPEAHLNPRYIKEVVNVIFALAKRGVQLFISTHDYLLSQKLSLLAEYPQSTAMPSSTFFSLRRTPLGTEVEQAEDLSKLNYNPILEEFADYADWEEKLMYP